MPLGGVFGHSLGLDGVLAAMKELAMALWILFFFPLALAGLITVLMAIREELEK